MQKTSKQGEFQKLKNNIICICENIGGEKCVNLTHFYGG